MASATSKVRNNSNWALPEIRLACAYLGLMDFTLTNISNALRCAQRLSSVSSASEFNEAMTNSARDQFEALAEQIDGLSTLIAPEKEDLELTFWE